MARSLPTEESLGLSPTEDELTPAPVIEDDVSVEDDPVEEPEKEEPKAAEKAEQQPKAEEKPEEDKKVDLRALQEARAEAREAKRQAAILEQRWNDFLTQQAPKPEAQPEQIPGPEDPLARLNWTTEQIAAMREAQARQQAEQQEKLRQDQAYQAALTQVDADFRAAAEADPTLNDAYNALRESQGKELLALGYSIPEAKAQLDEIERQHVLYVAQRGISIADHIRNLAQVRGWRPAAAQAEPAPAPKTDLAAVAAAQQRHQSLSDAPGGEAIAPLDAKALAKMSDKEFKAWLSKKGNEAKFDEIMGA